MLLLNKSGKESRRREGGVIVACSYIKHTIRESLFSEQLRGLRVLHFGRFDRGNNLEIVKVVEVSGAEACCIKQNGSLVWRSSSRKQWPRGGDCHRKDES